MVSSLHHQFLFSLLILFVFIAAIPAYGQGGPPMITDDPFTPEHRCFENNVAIQFTGTSSSKEINIPTVDINYGYGDHIQLKIEMPVVKYFHDGDGSLLGSGNVNIGMKARFLDEEKSGIAVSTFPQYEFKNSSIAEGNEAPQFFLPIEAAKTFGRIHLAAEIGYNFVRSYSDELSYGVVGGYDVDERWEVFAELHRENELHGESEESIVNFGMHYELSSSFVLLGSAGTTLNMENGGHTYLVYAGVQVLF